MVKSIFFRNASKNRDSLGHSRLVDLDGCESSLKGSVLFDVFSVLIECRRSDATKLSYKVSIKIVSIPQLLCEEKKKEKDTDKCFDQR